MKRLALFLLIAALAFCCAFPDAVVQVVGADPLSDLLGSPAPAEAARALRPASPRP